MQSETNSETKKCHICFSEDDLVETLEVNICKGCYDSTIKYFLEFEKSRTTFYPEIDKIDDKIFLGNADASRNLNLLKSEGITHILVVGSFLEVYHPNDFVYKTIRVNDSVLENMTPHFQTGIDFMKEANKVFVHCAAGISRSSSMVIAYCIQEKGMVYEEAYIYVKNKRNHICPNSSFIKQLKEFEEKVHGEKINGMRDKFYYGIQK